MAKRQKQFLFKETDQLYAFSQEILSVIQANTDEAVFGTIRSNCQLILIELLTNAIKHTSGSRSMIELVIDEYSVRICRADTSEPFTIKRADGVIYCDDLATLYGVSDGENKMIFRVKDHDLMGARVTENLVEHYGLLIITKASDEFTYTYDPVKRRNVFTAMIRIG